MTGFMPDRSQCFVFRRVPLWVQNDYESFLHLFISDASRIFIGQVVRFQLDVGQLITEELPVFS